MPNQDPYIAQELLSHQTFLRRLAIDLVGKDADDLVQDVWQRALERPPHHGHQLRGWLARVARNLAADRWRGEARRTEREELASCALPESRGNRRRRDEARPPLPLVRAHAARLPASTSCAAPIAAPGGALSRS